MQKIHSIPFSFKDFLYQKRSRLYCSLNESIQQHIALIIVTRLGAFRFDPSYGCEVWEEDFIAPSTPEIWKDEIKDHLERAILKHEKRIDQLTLSRATHHKSKLHQKIEIRMEGTIKETNDKFTYSDTLYFSPYSLG